MIRTALVAVLLTLIVGAGQASAATVTIKLHLGEPCPYFPDRAGCANLENVWLESVFDEATLMHELGHIIDFQLMDDRLRGVFGGPPEWDRELFAQTAAACTLHGGNGLPPLTGRAYRQRCKLIGAVTQ